MRKNSQRGEAELSVLPNEEGGFQPTTTVSCVQGTQSLVPVVGGLESTQGLNPSAETPQEFVHPGGFDTREGSGEAPWDTASAWPGSPLCQGHCRTETPPGLNNS